MRKEPRPELDKFRRVHPKLGGSPAGTRLVAEWHSEFEMWTKEATDGELVCFLEGDLVDPPVVK